MTMAAKSRGQAVARCHAFEIEYTVAACTRRACALQVLLDGTLLGSVSHLEEPGDPDQLEGSNEGPDG